jgi:hypothetical protein
MFSNVFPSKQNMFVPLFSYLCMIALDHVCPCLYNAFQAVNSPRSYAKWVSVSANGSWLLRMITTPGNYQVPHLLFLAIHPCTLVLKNKTAYRLKSSKTWYCVMKYFLTFWRHYDTSEGQELFTHWHSVTLADWICSSTTVRTSNLTQYSQKLVTYVKTVKS